MRLKYYLRGAGIGMIVTTIILLILFNSYITELENQNKQNTQLTGGETVAQAQTEQRQTETENSTQTESSTENTQENMTTESKNTEDTEAYVSTEETVPEDKEEENNINDTEANLEANENSSETNSESQTAQNINQGKGVILEIRPGDTSDIVAGKMQQLGLVEDASEFNQYLIDAGIDERLRTGSYEMKIGESFEVLASILVK